MNIYILNDENYLISTLYTNDKLFVYNGNYTTTPPILEYLNENTARLVDGKWIYEPIKKEEILNETLREQSYETLKCITWESTEITVDEANKLFLNYFAENNPKANEIQPLIIEAKEYIRTLYPDKL